MSKRFASIALVCTICLLVIAPAAGAAGYPIPKPKGGTKATKTATKRVGKKLEHTSVSKLAKGFKITAFFAKAGKVACYVKHNGTRLGSGSGTKTKKGTRSILVTFNFTGITFLKEGAGKKVTVRCIFTPKKGKSATSSVTVTLG